MQVANAYLQWPPDEDQIPDYGFVILLDHNQTVGDFAHSLGITIPDLVDSLKKRGGSWTRNTVIPLPVMRAIAFENDYYPAYTQQEYDDLVHAEEEEPEEGNAEEEEVSAEEAITPEEEEKDAKDAGDTSNNPDLADLEREIMSDKPSNSNDGGVGSDGVLDLISDTPDGGPSSQNKKTKKLLPVATCSKPLTVPKLAKACGAKPFNVMAELIKIGVFPAPNVALSEENARGACELMGYDLKIVGQAKE